MVPLVMNKMFCTAVLIVETFDFKIMLNMPRINFDNGVRAKSFINFGLSHRDVTRLLIFFTYNNIQIMAKFQNQNGKCTLTR